MMIGGPLRAARPLLFLAGAGGVVLVVTLLAVRAGVDPHSPRTEYGLHVAALVAAAAALAAPGGVRAVRHHEGRRLPGGGAPVRKRVGDTGQPLRLRPQATLGVGIV
jgi:hypothetical protein